MGAVLYCIHELGNTVGNSLALNERISAQRAYELGVPYVKKKRKKH